MNPVHVDINWQDNTTPAINQTNLGQINNELATYDSRIVTFDTTKANQSDLLKAFKDVSLNTATGVITFTLFDNTTKTIDTLLEKIAINFDYDDDPSSPHYQNLIIELEDGTYKYIDMSALITEYEFVNSSTVAFTVGNDGSVSASVIDGSITATKCDPTFALAISDAKANGLKSEGYANGTQNGTPVTSGSPYYENNAKYWKEQAQAIAGQTLGGLTDVTITTPSDGDVLTYDSNSGEWENKALAVGSKAEKTDLTSIIATGSTNTTGAQIPNGAYFYLNGVFCRAIVDIAANATFTKNTNYVETSVGGEIEHRTEYPDYSTGIGNVYSFSSSNNTQVTITTMTEDCWAAIQLIQATTISDGSFALHVNTKTVFNHVTNGVQYSRAQMLLPLKKGDIISASYNRSSSQSGTVIINAFSMS